ncbi:MAG: aldo/keto reductase [Victivallaceae bacterium]|nr:aldo/keto reductase [Victivallaceae bacterium]
MSIGEKELKCGFKMPVFGMGTWMLGGDFKRDPENDGQADIASLICGMEHGLKHIDTAEMYAEGFAEEITGQAIKGHNRANLFISSKVWSDDLSYDGVLRAAEKSLERLGTDYLDLYLIHKPNDAFPPAETMRAFNRLADEKTIKNIGVSNFAPERFKRAQNLCGHKIVANQVHYSLASRGPEQGLLEFCRENDVMLIAWRPLSKGAIIAAEYPFFDELCRKYRKTRAQIALNWLLSQDNVVTISTMRSTSHLEENLGALNWKMNAADIETLRTGFPGQEKISSTIPLT